MTTINDLTNFFSSPDKTIANAFGNTQIGGQTVNPVAPPAQGSNYQFQGSQNPNPIAATPTAPVAPPAQAPAPTMAQAPAPVAPPAQGQPLIPGMSPQPMTIPQAGAVNQGGVTPAVQAIAPVVAANPQEPTLTPQGPSGSATPINPQDVAPPAPAPAPAEAPAPAPAANEPADTTHVNNLMDNQNDPSKLAAIAQDKEASPAVRKMSNEQALHHLKDYAGTTAAEAKGDQLLADAQHPDVKVSGPASREVANLISRPSKEDEGSYLKAYLFHRFGLSDLAKQEQVKLGAGSMLAPVRLSDGTDAIVRQRADGVASYGVDRKTGADLTPQQLQEATGLSMPGAETSKSLHQYVAPDGTKHVVSVITGKNGQIRYRDDTDNKYLPNAPAGMEQLGHEDYLEKQANMAKRTIMSKMRGEDQKYFAQTGNHLYNEDQILEEGNKAYMGQTGGKNANAAEQPAIPGASTTSQTNQTNVNNVPTTKGEVKNFNPGNIRYGDFARSMGATGQSSNGIAIFPDMATGDKAHDALLGGSAYKNMTLGQIIGKWAPNNENNPAEYYKTVKSKLSGMDMDKTYNELTPDEKSKFRAAQTDVEHGLNKVPASAATTSVTPTSAGNERANALRNQAIEVYEGRQPMPTGMGANNYRNQELSRQVQQIAQERGQPFNAQKYKQNQEIIKDFSTGNNSKSVDALKTAFNHIDELEPAIKELNNGRFPAANAIVNRFATAVGGSKALSVEQMGPIVGNEIEKTWNPRMGTEQERAHIVQQFSSARNSEQLQTAVNNYKQLMMGKLKPLEDRYNQTGQKDFWQSQINDPNIKTTYDKWQAGENVRHNLAPNGTTTNGIKFKVVTQ